MKAELRRWGNTEAEPKQEEDASPNLEDRISKSKPPHLCCKITMALITWIQGQTLSEGWCETSPECTSFTTEQNEFIYISNCKGTNILNSE